MENLVCSAWLEAAVNTSQNWLLSWRTLVLSADFLDASTTSRSGWWKKLQIYSLLVKCICNSELNWDEMSFCTDIQQLDACRLCPVCLSCDSSQGELQNHWPGKALVEITWSVAHSLKPHWCRVRLTTGGCSGPCPVCSVRMYISQAHSTA